MVEPKPRPPRPVCYPDQVPAELQAVNQWVAWRYAQRGAGWDKPPLTISGQLAAVNNPSHWCSFDDAVRAALRPASNFDGIGFVVVAEDPYVVVDLDHCVLDGTLAPWARNIVETLRSYAEVSPSGTGLHVIAAGALPEGPRRIGGVEMYDRSRYITFTGDRWPGTPTTIERRQPQLVDVHKRHLIDVAARAARTAPEQPTANRPRVDLDDEHVLRLAMSASDGDLFARVWNGDTSHFGGDASRADFWLARKLAFYVGGDVPRIDALFQKSALMRPKWSSRRQDSTYGILTIERALRLCTETYSRKPPQQPRL
jgi:putative DNA primase/helicase